MENEFSVPAAPDLIRASDSRIVLDPALPRGLLGLEAGSQILVVLCFHRSSSHSSLQHPREDRRRPGLGGSAPPTLNHPNRVAVSIAELMAVEDNVLLVRGLDAIDGTPVLDIRPAINAVIEAARLLVRAQARMESRLKSVAQPEKKSSDTNSA